MADTKDPGLLHVAAVQADLRWESPEANRALIEEMLSDLEAGTDLVLLPEMFSTGFTMEPERNFEEMDGPTVSWMKQMAKSWNVCLMGSLVIREAGNYYNRLLAVGPEGIVGQYDKRHLFRMAGEHLQYTAGQSRLILEFRGWRICPLICYDLRFPVWSRNRNPADGKPAYDLLVYVANWPHARVHHWEALLRARAIENQAWVIGLNRVGIDGNGIPYSGASLFVDYQGGEISFKSAKQCVHYSELDLKRLREYREKFPAWADGDAI
jgi:predicted amidohydrolase